jgi:hypothetical protein
MNASTLVRDTKVQVDANLKRAQALLARAFGVH